MVREIVAAGEKLDHPWLLDNMGQATNDPRLEQSEPRGSLMLLGRESARHKGFGLALMAEALTQWLPELGRRDSEKRWGGSAYLQVFELCHLRLVVLQHCLRLVFVSQITGGPLYMLSKSLS